MERGILRFQFRIFFRQTLYLFQRHVQSDGQHIDNAQMFLVLLTGTLVLSKDPRCGQSIQMRTVIRVRTAKTIRWIRGTRHGRLFALRLKNLPVDPGELLQNKPHSLVPLGHLLCFPHDSFSHVQRYRFTLHLRGKTVAGHGRRLGDRHDKEDVKMCNDVLPETIPTLLKDIDLLQVILLTKRIYTLSILTTKLPQVNTFVKCLVKFR